jgi:hypothetical protein
LVSPFKVQNNLVVAQVTVLGVVDAEYAVAVYPVIDVLFAQSAVGAAQVTVILESTLLGAETMVGASGTEPGTHASAAVTGASRPLASLLKATDCADADAASRNDALLTGSGAV